MVVLLAMLSLVVSLVIGRIFLRDWTTPGVLFTVLWCGYVLVSVLLVESGDFIVNALLWVLLACTVVFVGSVIGTVIAAEKSGRTGQGEFDNPQRFHYLRSITIVMTLISMLEILIILNNTGFSFNQLLNMSSLSGISNTNRSLFGYGVAIQPMYETAIMPIVYGAPLFAGLLFGTSVSKRDKILAIIPLLVVWLIGTLYGSRMGVLFGGSFWVASFIAGRVYMGSSARFSGFMTLVKLVVVIILFMVVLATMTSLLRYRETDVVLVKVQERFTEQFAFFSSFAHWYYSERPMDDGPDWGYRTFTRIYELAGVSHPPRLSVMTPLGRSNIFGLFRDLIEDFRTIGALLMLLIYGVFGGLAYRKVQLGNVSYVGVLTVIYAVAVSSFAFSVFSYTTPVLALMIFCFYILSLRILTSNRGNRDLLAVQSSL